MRILIAIAVALLLTLAGAVLLRSQTTDDVGRIRIVAAPAYPVPPTPGPVLAAAPSAAASAAIPMVVHDEPEPLVADADALAALFASQERDPVWAPGAEAAIRSRLRPGGQVTCAEFMCRIEMVATADPTIASPDDQAVTASKDWPTGVVYNRYTATIAGNPGSGKLILYATRSLKPVEPLP